jgi:hypothetical protein
VEREEIDAISSARTDRNVSSTDGANFATSRKDVGRWHRCGKYRWQDGHSNKDRAGRFNSNIYRRAAEAEAEVRWQT